MEEIVWNTNMLISAVILVLTFVAIFTEGIHGIHRVKCGMAGAAVMIVAGQIYGFYDIEGAKDAIDWNVVFLLGGMMTIVAIMIPTGGFQQLAYAIADYSKGRLFLLMVLMGTLVTVLSLLLDNVTTVVIFGPLIILICQSLRVSAIPFLLAAALLSDIVMPEMDGISLALQVSRDKPEMPIILITGFAKERQRAHNLESLVHSIVPKPFDLEKICGVVKNALDGS